MSGRHLSALPNETSELTASAARLLTDNIRTDIEGLWFRLLDAYERGFHIALGYPSWSDYCKVEFGAAKSTAYQYLDTARVARAIESQSAAADSSLSGKAARELVPVLKEEGEEAVSEVWEEIVEEHGPTPTAAEVRGRVRRRKGRDSLTKEQVEFSNAVTSMELAAVHIASMLRTPKKSGAILDVPDDVRAEWTRQARIIDRTTQRLRRRFTR
jgi:hypothetical protein